MKFIKFAVFTVFPMSAGKTAERSVQKRDTFLVSGATLKIPLISNAGMPPEKNKTNVPIKKEALHQTEANSTKAKKNDTNKNNLSAANKKAQKGKKQSTGKKAKVSTGIAH